MINFFRLDVKLVTATNASSALLGRRPELLSLLRSFPMHMTSVKDQGPDAHEVARSV